MSPDKLHRAKLHRTLPNPGQQLGQDGQRLWLDNDKLLVTGTVGRYIDELIATGLRRTPSSSSALLAQRDDSLRAHLVAGVRHAWLIGIFEPTLDPMRRKHFEQAAHLRRCVARQATGRHRRCFPTPLALEDDPDANAENDRGQGPRVTTSRKGDRDGRSTA